MPLSGTQTSRERASGNAERHRWPAMPAAAEHSSRPRKARRQAGESSASARTPQSSLSARM
jgi:hypothetical protein